MTKPMTGEQVTEAVQDKMEWYEAEIERLNEVVRHQDERAKTTTVRVQSVVFQGRATFIVTCPAGDEAKLMRMMFAGAAAMAWTGFSMAAKSLGLRDVREAATVLFGQEPEEG